jgi:hypothetical protein
VGLPIYVVIGREHDGGLSRPAGARADLNRTGHLCWPWRAVLMPFKFIFAWVSVATVLVSDQYEQLR